MQAFGSGAMTNSIREIRDADCIFITGSNTAESHPVISYEVVRAAKRGANVIIVDPRRTMSVATAEAAGGADRVLHLQIEPGSDIPLLNAIARVIREPDLVRSSYRPGPLILRLPRLGSARPDSAPGGCGI